ncbi:MAG: hypothetical protein WEF86_01880 [Gemmatimonadota bacterium]
MKDKVGDATHRVQEKVAGAAAEVRHTGEHLVDEARELSHRAGGMARTRAEQQKDRVADGIRSVAEALRKGTQELPEDRRQYASLLDTVADRVEGASGYLDSHDMGELATDVRRLAREHTPLFLGGAFALGVIGARFLKSSGEESRRVGQHDRLLPDAGSVRPDYGSAGYGSTGYDAGASTGLGTTDGPGTARGYAAGSAGSTATNSDSTSERQTSQRDEGRDEGRAGREGGRA